jgi:hypothetical protein
LVHQPWWLGLKWCGVKILSNTFCIIGWVDIGTRTKLPRRFVTYLSKVTKINNKSVLIQWPLHHLSKHFGSRTILRSHIFFLHNMGFMGIKRRRILCRFQKYKPTLVTKYT